MTGFWADRCVLRLTLRAALRRDASEQDVVITGIREGGAWEPQADGVAASFNSRVHPVRWVVEEESATGFSLDLRAEIHPDPWVAGGTAAWRVVLRRDEEGVLRGTYTGLFTPLRLPAIPLAGPAEAVVSTPFTVSGALPNNQPAILEQWRTQGAAGLLGDWSRCGLLADGSTEIPQRVFRAVDFAVRPDSGQDATVGIQAAIDACAAAGGGTVELPPGRLDLAVERDDTPLVIRSHRVHLRGAGSGRDGTLLYAHRPGRSDRRGQPWRAGLFPRLLHIGPAHPQVLDDTPPMGPVVAEIVASGARGDRHLFRCQHRRFRLTRPTRSHSAARRWRWWERKRGASGCPARTAFGPAPAVPAPGDRPVAQSPLRATPSASGFAPGWK